MSFDFNAVSDLNFVKENPLPRKILASKKGCQDLAAELTARGFTVRMVRGSKMRSTEALFDEFSAAFQFPLHFGQNWDAFYDCISDLSWLPLGNGLVLLISEAEQVLTASPKGELSVLVECLQRSAVHHSNPAANWDPGAEPFPFSTVLAFDPHSPSAAHERLETNE